MNVRSASFRDLGRIEQLYGEALAAGDDDPNQLHSDTPVPQASTLVRLWFAVSKTMSALVPLSDGADTLYVAEHQDEITGFVQAQPAPGKTKAWQIVNLCTSATAMGQLAAEHLLTGLCQRGQEAGVQRFYVRLPLDHPLLSVFIDQGFTQYATEQILFCDAETGHQSSADLLRSARRDDIGGIHLLYLRVTPATVAAIESPNLKTWESTFGGGVMSRVGKDDLRHFVAERSGIYAWAAIRPASAARPTGLMLMCETQNNSNRDAFLDALVAELPEGPVSCVLRHYDSELIRALQQRGFAVYGTQVLLTKDLEARVRLAASARQKRKKPVLVPAGLVRNVPTTAPSPVPLRVIGGITRRGGGRSETSQFR